MSKKKKKIKRFFNQVRTNWINKRTKILKEQYCYNDEMASKTAEYEWESIPKNEREQMVQEYKNIFG